MKKKKPSWTIEEAQRAAAETAKRFGLFECDRCAKEIAKRLGKGFSASFERLRTSDQSDMIGLAQEGMQISTNGIHLGIRIGNKIFDNLHHDGVPSSEWAGRFITATEAALLQRSRPTGDFFGRIFLVKRFHQWLFGS